MTEIYVLEEQEDMLLADYKAPDSIKRRSHLRNGGSGRPDGMTAGPVCTDG